MLFQIYGWRMPGHVPLGCILNIYRTGFCRIELARRDAEGGGYLLRSYRAAAWTVYLLPSALAWLTACAEALIIPPCNI